MSLPRVLFRPRVVMSPTPEMVCIKTPTDSPEIYFETMLDPDEAIDHASQILADALRAKRMRATQDWLAGKR